MNRRSLLTKTFQTSMVLSGLGLVAHAQTAPVPKPPVCPPAGKSPAVKSVISSNHGHEFAISYEDVIKGKAQVVMIKGKSGHPHTVNITEQVLAALRTSSVVEVESSTDAGHTHIVRITRDIIK